VHDNHIPQSGSCTHAQARAVRHIEEHLLTPTCPAVEPYMIPVPRCARVLAWLALNGNEHRL